MGQLKDWMKEIKIEEIPLRYRDVAQEIGTEALLNLAQLAGGTTLYVPKLDSLTQNVRDRRIVEEFDGSNYRELALKYGLTESWVRQLILKSKATVNQTSLFEIEEEQDSLSSA